LNAAEILAAGEVEVLGLLPFSSNYVFLAKVTHEQGELHAVYKPQRGERPLWDFPSGTLAAREVAAYELSAGFGWEIVPPTVMREDAPLGPGSLQVFVKHDPERHYFTLIEERAGELMRFAAFDITANNADRKAGHVIEGSDGHLWGVDHGLTFNVEPKLRTVIWDFAGFELGPLRGDLEKAKSDLDEGGSLHERLVPLLEPAEIAETRARLTFLLKEGVFPAPEGPFALPWPLV
jgi:uncharacterized repeat protein (TIGR03843 family)